MSPEQQPGTLVMGWDDSWLLGGTPIVGRRLERKGESICTHTHHPVHTPQADFCGLDTIQEGKLCSSFLGHLRKTAKLILLSELLSSSPTLDFGFAKAKTLPIESLISTWQSAT